MQQSAEAQNSGGGSKERFILFHPGLKPGVNEALQAMFAGAKITVFGEIWTGSASLPEIVIEGGFILKGMSDIRDYVAFCRTH